MDPPVQRILIFYASVGSGHLSAARAIQAALLRANPGIQVQLGDAFGSKSVISRWLDFLSGWINLLVPGLYTWSWRTGSLGSIFRLSSRLPWFRANINRQIKAFRPDCIICTHAMPCAVSVELPEVRGKLPLVAVATDFDVHPYWPARQVTAFITAGETGRSTLLARGVDAARIFPFGIPVRADLQPLERQPAEGSDLSILVVAGGRQSGPYLPLRAPVNALLRWLAAHETPAMRWEFIFGANTGWLNHARQIIGQRSSVELLGFVEDLPRHLASAHLLLTKPGGLTLAEACALGTPALLLTRGAGQEAANTAVLLSTGAARLATTLPEVIRQVNMLRDDPGQRQDMTAKATLLGRPGAADKIARLICSLVDGDRL